MEDKLRKVSGLNGGFRVVHHIMEVLELFTGL
jgi:hypothetical protein